MANTNRSRAAARAALEAYRAEYTKLGGFEEGNGDLTDTADLIVDLAHLAETFEGENQCDGDMLLDRALDVWLSDQEGDEDNGCQGHAGLKPSSDCDRDPELSDNYGHSIRSL